MEGSKNLGTFSYSTTTLIVRLFSRVFGPSIESGNTYNARVELFYAVIRGMDCLVEVEPMLDETIPLPAEHLGLANADHEDSRVTALI